MRLPSFARPSSNVVLLLFSYAFILSLPAAHGQQFQQDYTYQTVNGVFGAYWRPTVNAPWTPVIRTSTTVWLEYNCAYMAAICENANAWITTTGLGRTDFAFDFHNTNVGPGQREGRKGIRRDESCPGNWINNGRCPEVAGPNNLAQPRSYRWEIAIQQLVLWPFTALEPGSNNRLLHRINPTTGNIEQSRLKYTCDEFPPATFIQGGTGANTRCAAFFCGPGISAEQQWQGRSHDVLRDILRQEVESDRGVNNPPNVNTEVVVFYFTMTNQPNQIPAKVWRYDANNVANVQNIPFKKRDGSAENAFNATKPVKDMDFPEWVKWASSVSLDDLRAHSLVTETHILPNDTATSRAPLVGRAFENKILGQWDSEFDSFEHGSIFSDVDAARSEDLEDDTLLVNVTLSEQISQDLPIAQERRLERRLLSSIHGTNITDTPLLSNATESELEKAIKVVEQAIADSARLNQARYEHMARNSYDLAPGTVVGSSSGVRRRRSRRGLAGLIGRDEPETAAPALLDITPEIARAAALVAEADAAGVTGEVGVSNLTRRADATGTFWMEGLSRKGSVPWGQDSAYKVFRNVKTDYGAKGDGKTDDSTAIQKAMDDGKRCAAGCNGSTLKNAIVYFPPGDYLISKTIEMPFGTQVIGDANNRPTLIAAARFVGLGVLSTDKYIGGAPVDGVDREYFVNTANFYRQIRNVIVDITQTRPVQGVSAIHYQVAQATSMQNVDLVAKTGTNQRGLFAENGSGGQISDVNFKGGNFCIYGGEQQFTAQRLNFDGCSTAVRTIWDWGWVWKSITVKNSDIGFQLLAETDQPSAPTSGEGSVGSIGSASFIDSSFSNVGTAVIIKPLDSKPGSGSTGVVLENVAFDGVKTGVADSSGKMLLSGGTKRIEGWATGPIYSGSKRSFSMGGDMTKYKRVQSLVDATKSNSPYYERSKPQYETRAASDFVHLKDLGAKGDGSTDDSAAIQRALDGNVGKLIFVDAGTYILKDTVTIPAGSVLVGEAWSQFAASGSKFTDPQNPKPMLRVGRPGDVGSVELQDLIFTTQGPTAGAILVEWNIKASSQGAAGLWDCHARVGGATGTKLNSADCPAIKNGIDPNCQGASMLMHVTKTASGYFENMWLWVADHDIDDPDTTDPDNPMVQNSVYVARGFLIESTAATWLYGTASEHAVFYQYNFNKASNVFAGFLQTESPYYQPMPKPPEPFKDVVGKMSGDPSYRCGSGDFDGCDSSWAVMIRGSQNIFVAGAGLYSWFSTYTQDCIDGQTCQKALILAENNKNNIRLQHLVTIGAKYMIAQDGKGILASDNLNVEGHPRWSQITLFDLTGNQKAYISPDEATVIPMAHTTVAPKATFTLDSNAAIDIRTLPYDGNQNDAQGPGADRCKSCSFFRLISSTCCGEGGSLGNPLAIPTGVPLPVPIQLPAGFTPNQDFKGQDGKTYPSGKPLPNDVLIPSGTVFPKTPFVIPAGQSLTDGESEISGNSELIWIDPKIWDDDHPTVYCDDYPCTFQFPPWTQATSTINYPVVTVIEQTYTTVITRSAITVTDWVFAPYTVTGDGPIAPTTTRPTTQPTDSSTTGVVFFIWPPPPFGSTSTWPPVTYVSSGTTKTTRPPSPPHPPPTSGPWPPGPPPPGGKWPSITISVSPGKPGPTVAPCVFPAFQCPNPGSKPDGPGYANPEDDPDEDEEEDPEEEPTCGSDDGEGGGDGGGGSGGGGGGGGGGSTPAPTFNHPDPANNKVDCYNSGQSSNNAKLRLAAESFCKYDLQAMDVSVFPEKYYYFNKKNPPGSFRIDLSIEVKSGCEWTFNYDECVRYLKVPINSCDCDGEDGKHGGIVENSCVKWMIDPNSGI